MFIAELSAVIYCSSKTYLAERGNHKKSRESETDKNLSKTTGSLASRPPANRYGINYIYYRDRIRDYNNIIRSGKILKTIIAPSFLRRANIIGKGEKTRVKKTTARQRCTRCDFFFSPREPFTMKFNVNRMINGLVVQSLSYCVEPFYDFISVYTFFFLNITSTEIPL